MTKAYFGRNHCEVKNSLLLTNLTHRVGDKVHIQLV